MATAAPEVTLLHRDEAFESLYRKYVQDVYHYALALMRNPADAEDVTQTTFLNAYRAFQRGEQVRKPHNWLIKIAHNVARSRYARTGRRVKEVPLEDHVEHVTAPETDRPDIEGVLNALGRLPFNQRAALIMRELEGRSYIEIADTLDVSVAAVETLIFRARRSLKIRTAALRSILAVPLPTSLSQFFEGGGGAAVTGVGAGFLAKAAIALVAGAVATGVSSDGGTKAVAASPQQARPAAPVTAKTAATPSVSHLVTGAPAKAQRAARVSGRVRARVGGQAIASRGQNRVAPGAANQPAAAAQAPPGSTAKTPQQVTTTVADTTTTVTTVTQAVQQTAQQTVSSVVNGLPVNVPSLPPLPVPPPPPLPKLP
jgi:RNA polymerase sigma factor (sigma-70 family)